MNKFSAAAPALGYLYQVQYALKLGLESRDDALIALEALDDIEFAAGGPARELLQLKHRSREAALTDMSTDLWKTVRVWSERTLRLEIDLRNIALTLVTTAVSPSGSIAELLKPGVTRDIDAAESRLLEIAEGSRNVGLKPAFEAFLELDPLSRRRMIGAIHIVDGATRVENIELEIKYLLRLSVRPDHMDQVYERLEGWWLRQAIALLTGNAPAISVFDIHQRTREVAEQFRPTALPIDYTEFVPSDEIKEGAQYRHFVLQLRCIGAGGRRIENAIHDYYRAFEQRTRWAEEKLVISGELDSYERKLVAEWGRVAAVLEDELPKDAADDLLKEAGRKLLAWIETTADIRIRPDVSEAYVMRGSYHMLADSATPRVWWHPRFVERLAELLKVPA